MAEEKRILTVSALNEYLKKKLEADSILASIYIKGEISNFTNHKSGHWYFTLKDEIGTLKSVMFRSAVGKVPFMPENGMKVIAHGRVSVFVRDGQYIYYCDKLEPDGIGALYLAYEQLKKKLEAEGLFDPSKKKRIPKIPTRVGVITSPTGAAVRDIINVTGRRFPFAKVILYPALVQGADAEPDLINGVRVMNDMQLCDVIIIGRGGGSIEDLWAFNGEALARAVAASKIPVISAVGHETDFTICDFAADLRAPTPSAAAELAVPETGDLQRKIGNIVDRMLLLLDRDTKSKRARLDDLASRRVLNSPGYIVDDKRMALLSLSRDMENAVRLMIENKKRRFVQSTAKLETLNPMSVISRGYSAVFAEGGELIKSVDQVEIGDSFSFMTTDGSVHGKVTEKRKKDNV
ncbi:MAG: exodeoxyribonuclease VII large subunit [Clostridia bacterium]|nr:exodeoxyribonuclease VII large subunit [Clostridia bacterium]